MRVLLCGGGTAGHVMPAIAISEIIEKSFKGSAIAFAGREGGEENKAYIKTGHRLYTVEISGISRSISKNNIKSIIKIIKSGRIATRIINEFKPDIIIGTGGYVCYPFIKQGQRLNIKTVLHESNVYPGLVTRLLYRRCDKLLINYEGTKKYLKTTGNVEVVGNPTRAGFSSISKSEARQQLDIDKNDFLVVSFGGSLGSGKINEVTLAMIEKYTAKEKRICHIHSTGTSHFDEIKAKYPLLMRREPQIRIKAYIDDMPTVLSAADLAITRSGAVTLSELCRTGTPSILIPSPNVTANHQYINAEYMSKLGAAYIIEEKDLTPDTLYAKIKDLAQSREKLNNMSKKARHAYQQNTDIIIKDLLDTLSNG